MRMHVVQHVPFEGPGLIADWAAERHVEVTRSLALTEEYPAVADIDLLVLMGGPMDADDHVASPWLTAEKVFLAEAISEGKLVLGVCLGAQIIAEVLGGDVRRAPEAEIGWFPLSRNPAADGQHVFDSFGDGLVVGHWHGDTFALPDGVEPALSSEATVNQAFSAFDGRVVGLQFHIEWTAEGLAALIAEAPEDLERASSFVATVAELAEGIERYGEACRSALWGLLDTMTAMGRAR